MLNMQQAEGRAGSSGACSVCSLCSQLAADDRRASVAAAQLTQTQVLSLLALLAQRYKY